MFFSSLWAFFRGAAFRPCASSVAFSWSLSPCRLSRGLACRSLCAFSGLGVVRKSLFSPSYLRRPQIFLLGLWSSEVFSELSKTNFFFGASPKPPGHGGCTSSHFSEVFCSVPPFYFFRVFNKLAKSLFLYFFLKSGGAGSNAAKLSTLSKKYGGTAGVRPRASQKCSPPS